jgi:hypothetical protein
MAKQFQGRRILEIDQSETRIACGSLKYQFLFNYRNNNLPISYNCRNINWSLIPIVFITVLHASRMIVI